MFPQLLLGGLISGGIGLGKAIFGAAQALGAKNKAKKVMSTYPKYNIPEEYMKSLGIYQNLAQGDMPGFQQYGNLIGESTARSMTGAKESAISSNVLQGAVESAQDKELQYIRDLAQMNVQYKTQAQQNLASAYERIGPLKDIQYQMNELRPWEIGKNIETEQTQAGLQNMFGGLGDISSTVMKLVGTKYYADVLKSLQGQNSITLSTEGNQSPPVAPPPTYSSNLNNYMPTPFLTPYQKWMSQLKGMGYNPNL